MDISWHRDFAANWLERTRQGRVPHAVLLTGPAGVGKRAAASWMAAQHLGISAAGALPEYPAHPIEHADLRWIRPPDDKQSIGIDQIRSLVAELSLTSYQGGGKVAIIDPADAMTGNAANSLLKTLEEPPGDALLILIADRKGHMPATIFSRCQRLEFALPGETEGLAWLDRLHPGQSWVAALRLAGNAPLAAIAASAQLDTHAGLSRDLAAVAAGKASALDVAARWSTLDTPFVLNWLARQVQAAIFRASGTTGSGTQSAIEDSVLKRMDRRNLFCYLDTINRLRGQMAGSFNVQLTLEGLLIDLSQGLQGCGIEALAGQLPEMMVTR
ncbi:MAG: DNA polymerase III subunit [Gammaproteobacteria bacterium]|nr:DNA polymerase III subunit [Gammaproteobacteria bacterium]MDH5303089.1 DNA polymerase III subunit [Gammaproteobacteria bacterium]